MNIIRSSLVAAIMVTTTSIAAVPQAPKQVSDMFLAGNSNSIPANLWVKDSEWRSVYNAYEDAYLLVGYSSNCNTNFPTNRTSTPEGYPSFMESVTYGRQCVAFAKAATRSVTQTSSWRRSDPVIPSSLYASDTSSLQQGKMIAFFQGGTAYPLGGDGRTGHVGIFLKYQYDNGKISGIWIVDSNWKGNATKDTEGKIRKHYIPINGYVDSTFNGRFNALNYYFVNT